MNIRNTRSREHLHLAMLLVLCYRNAGALLANIIVYGTGWVLFGTGQRTLNTEQDEWKFTASMPLLSNNNYNKKLSYRRRTARRAMLVNACYVSRCMGVRNVSKAKATFKLIQGHWRWCHLITHIRFPISVPLHGFRYIITYFC